MNFTNFSLYCNFSGNWEIAKSFSGLRLGLCPWWAAAQVGLGWWAAALGGPLGLKEAGARGEAEQGRRRGSAGARPERGRRRFRARNERRESWRAE